MRAGILWAALFSVLAAQAEGVAQAAAVGLFAEANQQYRDGAYEDARRKYLEVVGADVVDARLFYNLGNACFKSDRLGEAILWYERARLLSPRDEDIGANLRFASRIRKDRESGVGEDPVWRFLVGLYELPSPNEISVTFTFLLSALFAMGIRRLWSGRRKEGALWVSLLVAGAVLTTLTGLFGAVRIHQLETDTYAIVTAREATARTAPDAEETAVFVIHEGTRVRVDRSEGTWLLIRLSSGLGGWILAENATVI